MNNNKNRLSLAIALGLLGSVASTNSMAAGFQLAEYSATGLGRAYAGEAAIADGADTQWRNVAMLTYLEGTQVSVGGIYVNPNIDVEGSTDGSASPIPSTPDTTTKSEDFAHDAIIPNLYVSHRVNQQLAIGFAVGTNYGMETDLGTDFTATNFGNEASVITKEINVNMAYQINQQFSVGGGVRYVIAEGSFGAVAPNQTGPLAGTTLKYMEGTDEAWGWQVGTAWQINDSNRIGFSYKSEVALNLEGKANGFAFNPGAPNAKYNGSMELALPATAELASYHQLNDKVAIHASFNWTDWSSFEKLEAHIPALTPPTQEIKQENWEDNYRLALGGTYSLNQKVTLRTGVAYDTSAVSEEHRTATIPETDRLWLSMGAGYAWSDNLTLDAGFTYIFAKDAKMHEDDAASLPAGGDFTGETTGNVWLVGVQANYRF
ncbi:outer membrane protein transport protein [Aliivibrio sp. EL58]|uniref:outer membrane protein transport protein n=1 Tax=Aliivibrio sp. EL58 TaxID=2107582 RepID=UPI000EFB76A5|nr:outer membrane protein transport protein [Aliivibrio sp. EL58]